jgi:hypothetical protein
MPEEPRVVETTVEARAGFLDRPALVILVMSVLLAIVFLVIAYAGFFGTE